MASNRTKNKKLASFSIDVDILEEFNKKCKICSINKSLLVENIMKDFIKKHQSIGTPEDLNYFLENYK